MEQRFVIVSQKKGLLLGRKDDGTPVWSTDSVEAKKEYEKAVTFSEKRANIVIGKLAEDDLEVRYVFVRGEDKRATKDECADAGLQRW